MKIMAPINSPLDCSYLVKTPAKEFYCGIVPSEWSNRFGYAISPNRREWKRCNLLNYEELKEICDIVHKNEKQVFAAFNANQYNSLLFSHLIEIIEKSIEQGIDGIIVADLMLLFKLKKHNINIPIAISGDLGVYNTYTINLLEEFNIKRLIFPRYTTLSEMELISKKFPDLEYEGFIFNERCDFCGSYCFATHGYTEKTFCMDWELTKKNIVIMDNTFGYNEFQKFLEKMFKARQWKMIDQVERTFKDSKLFGNIRSQWRNKSTFCGLCAIKKLKNVEVSSLKIIGRGMPTDEKIYLINLIDYIIQNNLEREQIRKLYHASRSNHYSEYCKSKIFCYYPEEIE